MRTTITLEPDVAARLKMELSRGKSSMKAVINENLRKGFGMVEEAPRKPFKVEPFNSPFQPGIDPGKLNQLADELEVGGFLKKNAPS